MDLFSVAGDYGAWDVLRSAGKKFGGTFGGLCPLIGCIFFYGLCPSAELHYTNCVPDFCCFFFFGGTFGGLCPLIACIFLRTTVCFFLVFRRNCTTQIVYLTSAEIFFSAELSIQTYGSAELNVTKCVVDVCWFNGFPYKVVPWLKLDLWAL